MLKCHYNTFSADRLERYRTFFWPLPASWGDSNDRCSLREIWLRGGSGGISLLPVLGLWAALDTRASTGVSKEAASLLAGVDPTSVRRGATALEALGLAQHSTSRRFGKRQTVWALSEALAARRRSSDGSRRGESRTFTEDYFYFPAEWVYGGNWAMLRATERLVLLAIATRAHTDDQGFMDSRLAGEVLRPGESLAAALDPHRAQGDERWSCVSYSEIRELTGLSRSAIEQAVHGFKPRSSWAEGRVPDEVVRYSPVWAHPTQGGSLVYRFRVEVPHWPWEVLNSGKRDRDELAKTLNEVERADDELPF
jgi:hypothetical protein